MHVQISVLEICRGIYNLILNSWLKWQSPQRKTSQIRSQRAGPTLKGNWQSISWYCFIGLSVSARTGKPATWRKAAGGTPTAQRAGKGTSSISRTVRSSSRRFGTCARWGAPLWKTRKPTKRGWMSRDADATGSERTQRSSPSWRQLSLR